MCYVSAATVGSVSGYIRESEAIDRNRAVFTGAMRTRPIHNFPPVASDTDCVRL